MDAIDFFLKHEEPVRSGLLALRDCVLVHPADLSECTKYGMPCYCLEKRPICYLWIDKKTLEPYVLFVDGNLLDHEALESGDRARMKILRVNPEKDLNVSALNACLNLAVRLYAP